MAKLVVLSEGFAGRSHDLTTDRTTVGRVEDNTFQLAEASVSSHHCEVLLKDGQVRIKDLNSTNGTFIDGNQITEGVLKPGQVLRLGKVALKLEGETPADAKKGGPPDATVVMPKGVTLNELGKGPITGGGVPPAKGFAKKDNRSNRLFILVAGVVLLVILGIILYLVFSSSPAAP